MSSSDAWHVKSSGCRPLSEEEEEKQEEENSANTDAPLQNKQINK